MELKDILEAILFSSLKPLSAKELQDILKQADESGEGIAREFAQAKAITAALETLAEEVENLGRGFRRVCVAGAWQFVTQSEYAPWVRALVGPGWLALREALRECGVHRQCDLTP